MPFLHAYESIPIKSASNMLQSQPESTPINLDLNTKSQFNLSTSTNKKLKAMKVESNFLSKSASVRNIMPINKVPSTKENGEFIKNFISKQNSITKVINNTMKKVKSEQDRYICRVKVDKGK